MAIRAFFSDSHIVLGTPPGTQVSAAYTAVPYVIATVHLTAFNRRALVLFLLDTGADRTTLHPQDALRIATEAEIKALGNPTAVGGAGQGMAHYHAESVIVFTHEDQRLEAISLQIHVAEPGDHNKNFPSLLGRDALEYFPLSFDQKGRTFTLGA